MKKVKEIIIVIAALIITFFSCTEDFVTKEPLGQESTSTFFDTEDNAIASLTAVYSVLRAESSYARNYWVFGDIASDDAEAGGESSTDQPDIQDIGKLIHDANNQICADFWNNMYQGIYRANVVIYEVGGSDLENTALKNRIVAEALFLRAMFHFDLLTIFGEVPVVDYEFNPDNIYLSRNTIAQVFSRIENDLLDAIDYLPYQYIESSNEGRVTKGAAKALLVKAYVYQSSYNELDDPSGIYDGLTDKWELARDMAEEIITDKDLYGYELDPDYGNIWRVAGENSSEHIFKINATTHSVYYGSNLSDGRDPWSIGIGNVGNVYQTCRNYINSNGYSIESKIGWGFNCPTQDLYNAFEEGDPRRDFVIVTEQDSMQLRVDGPWYHYDPGARSPTGMNHYKYTPLPHEWSNRTWEHSGPLDIKVIRYADLLLMAAEANYKTGNSFRATQLVNLVRKRARDWKGTTEPADYMEVTIDSIYLERRLELCFEGHRYFDMVRLGQAYDKLNGFYSNTSGGDLNFIQGKHEYFPIPEQEIVLSNNKLKQNPGY